MVSIPLGKLLPKRILPWVLGGTPTPDRVKPCVSMVSALVGVGRLVEPSTLKLLVSVIVELASGLALALLIARMRLGSSKAVKFAAMAAAGRKQASAAALTPARSLPCLLPFLVEFRVFATRPPVPACIVRLQ